MDPKTLIKRPGGRKVRRPKKILLGACPWRREQYSRVGDAVQASGA